MADNLPNGLELLYLKVEIEGCGKQHDGSGIRIAQSYGYTRTDSLLRAVNGRIRKEGLVPVTAPEYYVYPPEVMGSCLVLFDPHIPFQDGEFINDCFGLAMDWGVRTLVFGGDVFDAEAMGRFVNNPEETWEYEMEAGKLVQAVATANFERVLMLMGNHEFRLVRMLKGVTTPKRALSLIDLLDGVEISEYPYCKHPAANWEFGHPSSFSSVPGHKPARMAANRGCNVATGHNHYWGMRRDASGKFFAVDAGHCCLPQSIMYKAMDWDDRPAWNIGGLVIKNCEDRFYHYLLHPDMDWDAMKRMY